MKREQTLKKKQVQPAKRRRRKNVRRTLNEKLKARSAFFVGMGPGFSIVKWNKRIFVFDNAKLTSFHRVDRKEKKKRENES